LANRTLKYYQRWW